MKARDKKLGVLLQLRHETAPISLPDLLKKLPEIYPERSVRRWLNELVNEGLIERSGHKKGTRYRVIKNHIKSQAQVSSCFSSESARVIEYVKRPIYERQPITYNDQWLEAYRPNSSFYFSEALREQLHKAGQRASNQDQAGSYAHQIFNRLLIDLSYNSSRLEGNTYSLLDTERLVLQGISAEGKLDEEKVMIINHKEAIRYLVDHAPHLHIDLQTVCTIHYLLSDGLIQTKYSGKIRDHGVRIGGSTYIPLARISHTFSGNSHTLSPDLHRQDSEAVLTQHCPRYPDDESQVTERRFASKKCEKYGLENHQQLQVYLNSVVNKAALIKDPFEQSLFSLIHISYLQAFSDVNKRTARLSANIPLITNNLVPLSFNDVERWDYNSAMIAVYELQDVRPIIDLYVFSYLRTCVLYDSTIKALGYDSVRVRYRQHRRALTRKIVENKLVGSEMNAFINSEAKQIPRDDQAAFIEDLIEDLDQMDQSRIAGLGITSEQINIWLELYKSTQKK